MYYQKKPFTVLLNKHLSTTFYAGAMPEHEADTFSSERLIFLNLKDIWDLNTQV